MFSHVVIFWTDPAKPNAVDEIIAGANKFLKNIPGITHFHIGKMAGSHRPVVDQSYQVALNTVFTSKQAQDDYQIHPQHSGIRRALREAVREKSRRLRF